MERETQENSYRAAQQMLVAFGSVGAEIFDLTATTLIGEKVKFRRGLPVD